MDSETLSHPCPEGPGSLSHILSQEIYLKLLVLLSFVSGMMLISGDSKCYQRVVVGVRALEIIGDGWNLSL